MKSLQINSSAWMALGILMGFGSQSQVLMHPNSAIAVEAVHKKLAFQWCQKRENYQGGLL